MRLYDIISLFPRKEKALLQTIAAGGSGGLTLYDIVYDIEYRDRQYQDLDAVEA